MTGFGRGSASGDDFSVAVDVKTVNNRFLDVHMRAGTELASAEMLIKRRIGERLSRGRVDVTITIDRTSAVAYELNRPLIAGYIEALRLMQRDYNLSGELDINVLARLPGVMQPVRSDLSDEMIAGLVEAVDEAISELNVMREREGAALSLDMHGRLTEIDRQLPIIEAAAIEQVNLYRARLEKKMNELLVRYNSSSSNLVELDQSRLAQEVAYMADRSDISEEVTRLRSHIVQFRVELSSEADVGKRLDFLLQEFNREANTILSKSIDPLIKEAALNMKAEIEKLREQVQNVE